MNSKINSDIAIAIDDLSKQVLKVIRLSNSVFQFVDIKFSQFNKKTLIDQRFKLNFDGKNNDECKNEYMLHSRFVGLMDENLCLKLVASRSSSSSSSPSNQNHKTHKIIELKTILIDKFDVSWIIYDLFFEPRRNFKIF